MTLDVSILAATVSPVLAIAKRPLGLVFVRTAPLTR